jgi:aminoglycoside phosphotransferase (APT) family kinase protein
MIEPMNQDAPSAADASGAAPPAEIPIDRDLVSALLYEQHPDLADLPLQPAGSGWDNAMFRLGDHLAVRLPRRAVAAPLILKEQRWLAELGPQLPVALPVPVRTGRPMRQFPWNWSIVPWFTGEPVDGCRPDSLDVAAVVDFVRALHRRPPSDAPLNAVRGCPLGAREAALAPRIQRLRTTGSFDAAVAAVWERALVATIDVAPTWIHGDLHPRNLLHDPSTGALSAVLDWGDLASGDCATDLACFWMLIEDPAQRRHALAAYGAISPQTWLRARGWAVLFGVLFADSAGRDDACWRALGERTMLRAAVS